MSFRTRPIHQTLSIAFLAALLLGLFVWSTSRNVEGSTSPVAPALEPGNDLIAKSMQQMNDALKALGKGVTADNKSAMLDELTKFETALIAAKSQTPSSAAKIDEKKRPAYLADFRKTMIDTLKLAEDAEVLIVDAKYKDADTLIRNKLGGMKSTGHGKFKEEGGK